MGVCFQEEKIRLCDICSKLNASHVGVLVSKLGEVKILWLFAINRFSFLSVCCLSSDTGPT